MSGSLTRTLSSRTCRCALFDHALARSMWSGTLVVVCFLLRFQECTWCADSMKSRNCCIWSFRDRCNDCSVAQPMCGKGCYAGVQAPVMSRVSLSLRKFAVHESQSWLSAVYQQSLVFCLACTLSTKALCSTALTESDHAVAIAKSL
jgi:hypothetical protein